MTKLSEKLVKLVKERDEIKIKRRKLRKNTEFKNMGTEYIKKMQLFKNELKLINEKILKLNPNFLETSNKSKTNKSSVTIKSSLKMSKRLARMQKGLLKPGIISHNIPSSLNKIEKRGGINKQARMTLSYKKRKK